MFALVSYPVGVITECLILGCQGNQMRIVVRGAADTLDLEYRNSQWVVSEGERVDLEFVSAIAANEAPTSDGRVMTAGSMLD